MDPLATYVAAWKSCAADVEELLRALDESDWSKPTDCPGWTVQDVAAHLAALESELAGDPGAQLDRPDVPATEVTSAHTQAGVDARKDREPQELITEFTEAVLRRAQQLDAEPPGDPKGTPPNKPGGVDWDWQTLLHNRVIDLWVHEQDIRRAVDRPGELDTPAAQIVTEVFVGALPYVIGKRAGAEPGSTVTVTVDGRSLGFEVGSDARCRPTDALPEAPTARLSMDAETLTVLGAGRRDPLTMDVKVSGDRELAERLLQAMAVTP